MRQINALLVISTLALSILPLLPAFTQAKPTPWDVYFSSDGGYDVIIRELNKIKGTVLSKPTLSPPFP